MAKSTLDLYELFRLVVSKGGLVEVINKKLWREITKGLNLPSSITSAAFTLRTQQKEDKAKPIRYIAQKIRASNASSESSRRDLSDLSDNWSETRYMKFLYPYECERLKLSSPQELQAAIDGNRRETHSGRSGMAAGAGGSNCASPTDKLACSDMFQSGAGQGEQRSNKSQEDAQDDQCELFDESPPDATNDEADFGEVGSLNVNVCETNLCMSQPVSSLMHAILSSQQAAKLALPDNNDNNSLTLRDDLQLSLPMTPRKRSRCSEQADSNKLMKISVEICGTVYRGVLYKE